MVIRVNEQSEGLNLWIGPDEAMFSQWEDDPASTKATIPEPTVHLTPMETNEIIVFWLRGPLGPKGDKGDQGDQGDKGDQGEPFDGTFKVVRAE